MNAKRRAAATPLDFMYNHSIDPISTFAVRAPGADKNGREIF